MNEFEVPIMRLLEAYKAAVLAKDVDGLAALYDHDVRVFDMWGRWSYDGIVAWRAMVTNWFSSLGTETVVVEMEDVRIVAGPDVAIAHALVSYKSVSADGDELRAMLNRLTWALKREGVVWKIVHEHTSAPVDFTTAKIILQR